MRKRLTACIAIILTLSLLGGNLMTATANAQSPAPTEKLWTDFKTPSIETKSRPLWFWNDKNLTTTTKAHIREMMVKSKEESGYGGFGILPNWINGYMEPKYLDLYKYALETAEELGLKMCLYDENGFPSGPAGGILAAKYPDQTAKRLDKEEQDFPGGTNAVVPIPTGSFRTYMGAIALNTDTKAVVDISDKAIFVGDTVGIHSSSYHEPVEGTVYSADQAFDGDYNTRWNSAQGQSANEWLEVHYDTNTVVNKVVVREALSPKRIVSHSLQYHDGTNWVDIKTGTSIGDLKEITFGAVTAKRFRLLMSGNPAITNNSPTISELELFNGNTKHPTPASDTANFDRVEHTLPAGNWKIMTFATVKDGNPGVDFLSKQAVDKFIEITHEAYYKAFPQYFGNVIDSAFFDEPAMYLVQGARMWTGAFNEDFKSANNGENPITLYPALWYDIGENTEYARNKLMSFRTELLITNYIKNMNDWCNAHNIKLTGHMIQEENPSPVSVSGDLMKSSKYQDIPGVDNIWHYDMARKSFKVISSAAYNWDKGLVMTETYGAMGENMGIPVMFKDIMNQFAKGINLIVPHAIWDNNKVGVENPPELSYRSAQYGPVLPSYNDLVGRTSGLLQNGRHVADIGVMYPIDNLSASFTFDNTDQYWGPAPAETDYQEVGDILSSTIRRDYTYLHPEVIDEKCDIVGNELKLNNNTNFENYKVFIMPGGKTIRLDVLKKIKAFYDAGGKVIATTQLPYMSAEKGKNAEVKSIVSEMFNIPADQIAPAKTRTYTASSVFQTNQQSGGASFDTPDDVLKNTQTYAAAKAFDGVASEQSRWNAGDQLGADEWLEVEFDEPTAVNKVILKENRPNNRNTYRISAFRIQSWDGSSWVDVGNGTTIGASKTLTFSTVTTKKLRLYIDDITEESASIEEFEVYNGDSRNLALESEVTAENTNSSGGLAMFLGTGYKNTLESALDRCVDVYDVEITNPTVKLTGGDLTYIHKVKEGHDIYYFANSSDQNIVTDVKIRKKFSRPHIWNPHNGTRTPATFSVDGDVTTISLSIDKIQSLFIIDEDEQKNGWVNGMYYKNNVVQKYTWVDKKYFTDKNGKKISNKVLTISGKKYAFNKSGVYQKGTKWFTIGKKKYYISKGLVKPNVWVKDYRTDKNGARIANKKIKVKRKFYIIKKSKRQKGNKIVTFKRKKYYINKKGVVAVKKTMKYKGKRYFANKNGVLKLRK